jgi:hypothetical protein
VLVVDQFERLLPDDPEIDRVLELAGRNVRAVLAVRTEATELAFAPDNRELVAGGSPLERWSGRLWARTPDAIAGRICAVVARSLSHAEWRAAVIDRSWRATCE